MSMVIAAALALFFLVTLPQVLARQADARDRAEVDVLPERVRPITPVTHAAASDPRRATAPLLPRARRVEVLRQANHAPNLSLIQGGAEGAEPEIAEVRAEIERYQLPLASGELHPAMHTAVESETTMTVTASSGPQRPRLPRGTDRPATAGGDAAWRNAPTSRSATASGGARRNTRNPAGTPASPVREVQGSGPGDDGGRTGAWKPAPRKPVLLPLLGLVVLLGLGGGIVLAALAAFGVVTWSGVAASGVVTILAFMGVRSINVAHRDRMRAHRAAQEESERFEEADEEMSAAVAEDVTGAARREQMARVARSRRAAEARSAARRETRDRLERRTPAPQVEIAEPAIIEPEAAVVETPVRAPARSSSVGFELDDPISFDEVSADAPAEEPSFAAIAASEVPAAETWTPKSMPLPTYVEAPRATSGRGAADASLAEALAMEFVSQPGQRPEVDATLAHGRTATRGGKAEPQANKTVRAASQLDSVLQRRRA